MADLRLTVGTGKSVGRCGSWPGLRLFGWKTGEWRTQMKTIRVAGLMVTLSLVGAVAALAAEADRFEHGCW